MLPKFFIDFKIISIKQNYFKISYCINAICCSMKMENYPVKLEIFALKSEDDKLNRQLIGHLLFPVRNIPTLPLSRALTNKSRWYKLIGLASAEWRSQKPELFLSIMITDKEFFHRSKEDLMIQNPLDDSILSDIPAESDILTSQQGIFIRLLKDEGVLQVGDIDTACDVFLTKILLKTARNLETVRILIFRN